MEVVLNPKIISLVSGALVESEVSTAGLRADKRDLLHPCDPAPGAEIQERLRLIGRAGNAAVLDQILIGRPGP